MSKCPCEDSAGKVCGKVMSKEEEEQDGMCQRCGDQVWNEMTSESHEEWHHPTAD